MSNNASFTASGTGQIGHAPSVPRHQLNIVHKVPYKARIVVKLLQRMKVGALTVTFPDGVSKTYGQRDKSDLHASLHLHCWEPVLAALRSGDIGFGESYMKGQWTCDSLERLLSVFIANRSVIDGMIYGSWWGRITYRIQHLLNRNSKPQARKNIQAHYDLGNGFYKLWLDKTMTYSSAIFSQEQAQALRQQSPARNLQTLVSAQQTKIKRSIDQLNLSPRSHILEIGCGWGGIAQEAAERGHSLVGLTLSDEQLIYARERVEQLNLNVKSDLRLQDYRDVQERFDGIVSIEMFEAVGQAYWAGYFETIKRCLKQGGRALIQTITIDEALFSRYCESSDFIQQYIFPGGMLPSPTIFEQQAKAAGLKVIDRFEFGQDYARTLRVWHDQFLEQLALVRIQGFDEQFIRMWTFYLAYCEAAFKAGNINVIQFTLAHEQ